MDFWQWLQAHPLLFWLLVLTILAHVVLTAALVMGIT
ncbi:hypothetical protein IPA_07950 [Ignicoccus pacificus DSM 13166]|uniref:Uncharacterized protein n=1 Tax=Ignicoccus pacificus DSM 13166 TaxID=940294 RepID=A0A977KBU7_9CREN|nr:hypothetical protein IPA_07950 [Ignicoccus pacificus DSM 13166]